ncbi:hypothetical protein, partial [Stutzerimonas kirkiae]|uniref:hypothetical protein n=1 Tax=Stutzerimonas kirkiae TaxID=2211392 RepID=UPI001A956215
PGSTAWDCPGSHDLNLSNRPVRTRMPGGVAGAQSMRTVPYADSGCALGVRVGAYPSNGMKIPFMGFLIAVDFRYARHLQASLSLLRMLRLVFRPLSGKGRVGVSGTFLASFLSHYCAGFDSPVFHVLSSVEQ